MENNQICLTIGQIRTFISNIGYVTCVVRQSIVMLRLTCSFTRLDYITLLH